METRYEVLCVNVKLIEVQLLLLRAIFQILPLLVANVSFTDARTYVRRMVDLAACGKFPAMSLNPVVLKFFTFCKQYVGVLSHHFSDRELNAIDGFHSDVIRVQSQKSEVVRILIYTRLKNNRK